MAVTRQGHVIYGGSHGTPCRWIKSQIVWKMFCFCDTWWSPGCHCLQNNSMRIFTRHTLAFKRLVFTVKVISKKRRIDRKKSVIVDVWTYLSENIMGRLAKVVLIQWQHPNGSIPTVYKTFVENTSLFGGGGGVNVFCIYFFHVCPGSN